MVTGIKYGLQVFLLTLAVIAVSPANALDEFDIYGKWELANQKNHCPIVLRDVTFERNGNWIAKQIENTGSQKWTKYYVSGTWKISNGKMTIRYLSADQNGIQIIPDKTDMPVVVTMAWKSMEFPAPYVRKLTCELRKK